jgi:vacuolar-type H+-ATPase subunit I/STV1
MNWVRFKEELEEFCSPNKLDLGDVFRLKQEKTQTIYDFIKLVEESSRPHKLKNEEKIKIILTGLREEIPDVRRLIIRSKIIDDVLIEDIHLLEETFLEEKLKKEEKKKKKKEKKEQEKKDLESKKERAKDLENILSQLQSLKIQEPKQVTCYNCGRPGHTSRYCRAPRENNNRSYKRINEVVGDAEKKVKDLINKNNSLYINGILFEATFDTGSHYNFISDAVRRVLKLKTKRNHQKMTFYTCLDEPFFIEEHVF